MITNPYASIPFASVSRAKGVVKRPEVKQQSLASDTVNLRFQGGNNPQLPEGLEKLRKLTREDDHVLLLPPVGKEFNFLDSEVLPASYGKLRVTDGGKIIVPQAPHIQASDNPVKAALRNLFTISDITTTLMDEKGLVRDKNQARYVIVHQGQIAGPPKREAQIIVAPKEGFNRVNDTYISKNPTSPYTAITIKFSELETLGFRLDKRPEKVNPFTVIEDAKKNNLDPKSMLKDVFIRPGSYVVLTHPDYLPVKPETSQKVLSNLEKEIENGKFPLRNLS